MKLLTHRKEWIGMAKAKNPRRWSGVTRQWERIDVVNLNRAKINAEVLNQAEVYRELKLAQ